MSAHRARRPRQAPSRAARNLVLLLLGVAVSWVALDGTYRLFVAPVMRWPLLWGGVVTVLLALVDIGRHLAAERAREDGTTGAPGAGDGVGDGPGPGVDDTVAGCDCEDPDAPGPRPPVWLLPLPAVLLLFVGPGAVTPSGAESGGIAAAAGAGSAAAVEALPPGPAPELGMWDLARRASARDGGASLAGREVTVVASVLRGDPEGTDDTGGPDSPDDTGGPDNPEVPVRLGRVVITCCAADAHVVSIRVEDPASLRLLQPVPDDGWVRARVLVRPGTATRESRDVPAATVTAAEPVAAPADVYEYPRR